MRPGRRGADRLEAGRIDRPHAGDDDRDRRRRAGAGARRRGGRRRRRGGGSRVGAGVGAAAAVGVAVGGGVAAGAAGRPRRRSAAAPAWRRRAKASPPARRRRRRAGAATSTTTTSETCGAPSPALADRRNGWCPGPNGGGRMTNCPASLAAASPIGLPSSPSSTLRAGRGAPGDDRVAARLDPHDVEGGRRRPGDGGRGGGRSAWRRWAGRAGAAAGELAAGVGANVAATTEAGGAPVRLNDQEPVGDRRDDRCGREPANGENQ